MPKQNPYLIKENLAKVEVVREIPTYQPKYTYEEATRLKEQFIAEQKEEIKKYQVKGSPLSPEARSKVIRKWGSDYVSENREGYGPNPSDNANVKRSQHLISTLNRVGVRKYSQWEASAHEEDDVQSLSLTTSSELSLGAGGTLAGGEANLSGWRIKTIDGGDVRFLSGTVGGEIGEGALGGVTARYSLGADVMNVKKGGFRINAGIDGGSGVSAGPGGVEVKAAGFGVSVGKKMGFSTPVGGVSVDLEEGCVVQ